jgi:hypothetical protein
VTDDRTGGQPENPGPGATGRIHESAGTIRSKQPPPVAYRARDHAGQRPPFHAIPALALYVLLVVAAAAVATYAIKQLWWVRAEFVSTHGLLPEHRLNKPVTATAMEMGEEGQRLLVADQSNLFVGTPIRSLRYWQWFPIAQLGRTVAGSTIRGLSASDGNVALVPERADRRGLVLGTLPRIGAWPALWDRPVIDMSRFPRLTDKTARAALYDRRSGDWLIGALDVSPYNADTRQWKPPLLRAGAREAGPQINDLTALGDGMIATLGSEGIDTLRWIDDRWRTAGPRIGEADLRGSIPRVAQFSPLAGQPAGTGALTYLSEAFGLGQMGVVEGRIEGGVNERIGEGRADGISFQALTRATAGNGAESAWMLYRSAVNDEALRVALYRFKPHQMLGLPAGRSIPVGSDAIIASDPIVPETAWVAGHGLFSVKAGPGNRLEAVDAKLAAKLVEEVAPARDTIFATAKADGAPKSPAAVVAAPRTLALGGSGNAWSAFIGARRLDTSISLDDITAAADGDFKGHDSLILGTRKDGIILFDRVSRELFRPFTDAASAAVVAPGSLDLHARGRSIVQVTSDHSVNLYNGSAWRRLIAPGGADLVANRLRAAVSDVGASALVLSDGKSNAIYDARAHQWYPLPPLEVSRMVAALDSLWAVTPAGVLHRLPFADPQWQPIDSTEHVLDLYAQPDMIAVLVQQGTTYRIWTMRPDASARKVVFESNESAGDPAQWRTFAVQEKQLFVAPHANGAIGRYDRETHKWSTIPAPAATPARDLVATDRGLWFVDSAGLASFRPKDGDAWTALPDRDRVQTLRMGMDGNTVVIETVDRRVLVGEDASSLQTIVGGTLSAAPDKITAGVFFEGSLIVASNAGIHRYDAQRHDWENAPPRPDPIAEFAYSTDALYARTAGNAVLQWNSKDLAGWAPVNDASGTPLRAVRIAGAGGAYVAVVTPENGVSALFAAEPAQPKPLLLGSRLQATGPISAAVEFGQELVVGTKNGALASYAKDAAGPQRWTDLANPGQIGAVGALLIPPGRTDRIVVVGTPQAQTSRLAVLERRDPGGPWAVQPPVLANTRIGDAAVAVTVDADGAFAIDSRADAAVPLARVDLGSRQETAIVGAAFPAASGGRASTRAIGVSPLDSNVVWRADQVGQVAAYDLVRHSWQQSADLQDVDRFFTIAGKLWSWSRSRGALAVNEGRSWRREDTWREVANDADRVVLLGRDGNVVVRDAGGERTILGAPARAPLSSVADIATLGEFDGRLFVVTKQGPLVAYEVATHRWRVVDELPNVEQFAATVDRAILFARTREGALWRLDRGILRWRRVDLPAGQNGGDRAITGFRQQDGELLAIDSNGGVIVLPSNLERLGGRLDDEAVPPPLVSWRLETNAQARLLRALPDGSFVEVSLTPEGFGFDRVWAVGCGRHDIALFTQDGLVRMAGDGSYDGLPGLDRRFVRPDGLKGTGDVLDLSTDDQAAIWVRAQEGVWRHDGQAWQKDSAENLQRLLDRARPTFWDDGRLSWSRSDVVTLRLPSGPAELRFRVPAGRFDADQPFAIAADQAGIVLLTPDGVVRYGADFSWQHVAWPLARPPADVRKARLVTSRGDVLVDMADGALFRWSGQGWSQLERADVDAVTRSKDVLLDGRIWRASQRQGSSELELAMRPSEDKPFVRVAIQNGRFDFETARDVVATPETLWIATQFGIVGIDPATRQISALHRTDAPVQRLATQDTTIAARLDGGATLVYRDAQWQPGGSAELFAEADNRVVQDGPWKWSRSPAGPKVQLTSAPGSEMWTATEPLEVRFSGNRFAFDDVRDVAFAEGPWLATAAGLLLRGGSAWTQIDRVVAGKLTEGSGWSGTFTVGTSATDRTLLARIDGQLSMLVAGEWRPADAVMDRSLIQEQGARNAYYEITRAGGRIQVRLRFADDPAGRYVPAEFDRTLRRFRHDMPTRITRHPADTPSGLLVSTKGGILALDIDRNVDTKLFADPANDGIGTDEITDLVYVPAANRSLARLANRRIVGLDAGSTRWSEGGEDSKLLDTARRVPQNDPNGWRIEMGENQLVRLAWRGQSAILVSDSPAAGQAGNSTRFAHDVAYSAFVEDRSIVIGTRGGIVRIPVTSGGSPVASEFELRATDVLTPAEAAAPRGIGFLRPGPNGADVYARRESDGKALRVSATSVDPVAPADANNLAASQVVAEDIAWTWRKTSTAPAQMKPSQIFHVPADYKFLGARTWSFLDIDQVNRKFPHRTMVAFRDDLFVATAGGVSRFAMSSARASGSAFITAVYAETRGPRAKPMIDITELQLTEGDKLIARTRGNVSFAFDPKANEWDAITDDPKVRDEPFRVADTPLLDWRFDEAGRHNILVRPLSPDLKAEEQSIYQKFSNGRLAFDDVRAILNVEDELWLATAGGICIYDRDFRPLRFIARAFLDGAGAPSNPLVRELVRDPDAPDRIVARMDSGRTLQAIGAAGFLQTAIGDVFERAYTRSASDPDSEIRLVQYPFGSYRFPQGALRARFHDSAGNWIELGNSGVDRALPLFSRERFAFDDVRDAILYAGQLLVATPVGVVSNRLDWDGRRVTIRSVDVAAGPNVPGQLPALHDMQGIVRMPNGAVMGWNSEEVFRLRTDGGPAAWQKERDQAPSPVTRQQVLAEPEGQWKISVGDDGAATIIHVADGHEVAVRLANRFGDVSRPISDRDWIYLPSSGTGLIQIEKAGIH